MIGLWALLTGFDGPRRCHGRRAKTRGACSPVIVPVSGFVAPAAIFPLAQPNTAPFLWPARLRSGAGAAAGRGVGAVRIAGRAIASGDVDDCGRRPAGGDRRGLRHDLADVASAQGRRRRRGRPAAGQYDADIAALSRPMRRWDWTPFLNTRDGTKQHKVLASIRKLDRRQAEAETMLGRGDFPLGYLGSFDLDPTSVLCEKARALLGRRIEPLVLNSAKPRLSEDRRSGIRCASRHELAGRIWLRLRCRIEGVGNHGEGVCRSRLRRAPSGRASRSQTAGTNLARAAGALLDAECAVASERMAEVRR